MSEHFNKLDKENESFKLIELYKSESSNVILNMPTKEVEEFVKLVIEAYDSEKKIFACGNGGNAAFVGNLVVDLNMHHLFQKINRLMEEKEIDFMQLIYLKVQQQLRE